MGNRVKIIRGLTAGQMYLKFIQDPINGIAYAHRKWGCLSLFGNVLPFRQRERLRVLALGPEFNRQVLGNPIIFRSTRMTVPGPPNSSHYRLSRGLIALNGELHSMERCLALPLFKKSAIEAYHQQLIIIIEQELGDWPLGKRIDIGSKVLELFVRISSRFLFRQKNPQKAYDLGLALHEWLRLSWPFVAIFPVNWPGTTYHHMLQVAGEIERSLLEIIEEIRHAELEGTDQLSFLIKSHTKNADGLSSEFLTGQIATLFLLSFLSPTTALTWTLFLLAQHPHVAADLVDELNETLHGNPPTMEELQRLPLLDAVVKESMRILPPVPYSIRQASQPAQLGEAELKKGDFVFCSHYFTHHMEDLFDLPNDFRPQRWFDINPGPFEYLPFSAGPRWCIGSNFAMTAIKTSIAMILQRFRPIVAPDTRLDCLLQINLKPKYGLPMVLYRQDRGFQYVPVQGNIHQMVKFPAGTFT